MKDPFEVMVAKAAKEAKLTVLERRWMFGPGYDRYGEEMADAVAKAVRRVLRKHRAHEGRQVSKGHHFCKPGTDEYASCCHCGEERAYRPLLNNWCPSFDKSDQGGA